MNNNELNLFTAHLSETHGDYLEIGVLRGASLNIAAKHLPPESMMHGVDAYPLSYVQPRINNGILKEHPAITLWHTMRTLGDQAAGRVSIYPCSSDDFIDTPIYSKLRGTIGFLFIDGAHNYEQVMVDAHFVELVRRGGLVAFDDYRNGESHEATRRGIDDAISEYNLVDRQQAGALVICRKS